MIRPKIINNSQWPVVSSRLLDEPPACYDDSIHLLLRFHSWRATMRLVHIAFLITLVAPFVNQAHSADPKKITSVEGITEYSLDNGLRVLIFPDDSRPKVTVSMTVFVGSRHEGYGETGMAHLLEHMVFKGTPKNPLIPKALQ